jgi:ribonuclease D
VTQPRLQREPADGLPDPITTAPALEQATRRLRGGHGPVAVDAERASGYRYRQRAYLVQLRRDGAGTLLIDPVPLSDLKIVNDAIADAEWIVHAASQDLPCLADIGLRPSRLFDTELAGRLLGEERVALGTMVEQHLGVTLEKGHSAADWSTRPLPREWLAYAALDVELLIPLRDVLAAELASAGKTEWARQEFDAAIAAPPSAPREDPWRRTSGIHAVRQRRQLTIVRSLWYARDELAAERDIAPGRVLPDSAIIAAALANPRNPKDLAGVTGFAGRRRLADLDRWFSAVQTGRTATDDVIPVRDPDAIPPTARWRDRNPEAAGRLVRLRAAVARVAAEHSVLSQNLLASDVARRIAWQPPDPPTEEQVRTALAALGARPWQIGLTARSLTGALHASADPATA